MSWMSEARLEEEEREGSIMASDEEMRVARESGILDYAAERSRIAHALARTVTRPASEIANEAKPLGVTEAEDKRTTHVRMASLLVAAAEQHPAGLPILPRHGAR